MQLRCTDGNDEQAGTVDKRVFIVLNGAPSGYTRSRKNFKEALILMFGVSYYNHFTRISVNKNHGQKYFFCCDFKNNE